MGGVVCFSFWDMYDAPHVSQCRTDHRLGRLIRLRDQNAATPGTTRWLDGVTTAVDEELSNDRRRLSRKYYVCLGTFTSPDEAMVHFCEMESRGRVIPCMTDPVDLEDMERSGDVMYVDDLPHPAISILPGWREEHSLRRELSLLHEGQARIRESSSQTHRYHQVVDPHAVARRNAEEQERRRLQVVAVVVDGLRSSPFYPVLPNARSRRSLDEMCLRAMAPVRRHTLAQVLPSGDVATVDASDGTAVSMRNIAEASKAYEADVVMFLLELVFAKTWACRTHGSVQAAREAARGEQGEDEDEKEAEAAAGGSARALGGANKAWIRDAIALSRFDCGVRNAIRNCLLHG